VIENSPGLHYQHEGEARLFNSEWKIVTYINLQQASENVDMVEKYIGETIIFLRNVTIHYD
jgi:hypothetical protein